MNDAAFYFPVLGFWQLGSAGMLAWGLAAAVPILIHLWSRRKYREEPWAAMAFLLAALRKNARRIQFEQWVLLAVRTAMLLLFAMALADPRLSTLSTWAGGGSGGQTHIVLVLDTSYSMGYRAEDQSRFDEAKQLARQLVENGPQGNGYTLVAMGDPPRSIIAQPAFEPDDVLQEIDNLQLAHAGASLPAGLAEVERILRQAAERQPRLIERRVCFFSDLQNGTWSEAASADCRARLSRLGKMASLELVDLGQPGESNLAIARVEIDQPLVAVGSPVQIEADVQSFAAEDHPRQAVEILVDGERIADERIQVPAGGRGTIAAPYRFGTAGDHVIEVRTSGDALPVDDRRWLITTVRDALRVLCIGGRPGETKHLALALAPERQSRDQQAPGPVQVTEAPESRLLEADLGEFDCLFLANIGRLSRDEASAVQRFVGHGGGLVLFLGDEIQAENYNERLIEDSPATLPAQLVAASALGDYRVDPLEYQHPIVAPFRGFQQAGLLTTPVWKYIRVAPREGTKTVLALENGDPLIVAGTSGRGRCVLVTTAASLDSLDRTSDPPRPWTALAAWPSFPPLVQEMLRFAVSGKAEGRNVLVGDDLTAAVPLGSGEQSIALTGPDGLSERLPLRTVAGEPGWSYGPTRMSGVYVASPGNSEQRYAVNVHLREGNLTRLDPELLPSQFERQKLDLAESSPSAIPGMARGYFRWFLGAVLVLLLAEPVLAWRFGRGRA